MKFAELRKVISEDAKKKTIVFSKKLNRIPVVIYKEGEKFSLYIDGDHLDDYESQKEAEKFATSFVKEIK